jgi:hypothetical protein
MCRIPVGQGKIVTGYWIITGHWILMMILGHHLPIFSHNIVHSFSIFVGSSHHENNFCMPSNFLHALTKVPVLSGKYLATFYRILYTSRCLYFTGWGAISIIRGEYPRNITPRGANTLGISPPFRNCPPPPPYKF